MPRSPFMRARHCGCIGKVHTLNHEYAVSGKYPSLTRFALDASAGMFPTTACLHGYSSESDRILAQAGKGFCEARRRASQISERSKALVRLGLAVGV